VSAASLQRAAKKYLDPANSVVVIVRPKAAPADSGGTK
jgi:predicted Zn-dependent peptidase